MEAVTGIFGSRADADRAIRRMKSFGLKDPSINVLTPASSEAEINEVPLSDTEQPGMGKTLGGFIGAVSGISLGPLSAAAITSLIPGIGPVVAVGAVATALLG